MSSKRRYDLVTNDEYDTRIPLHSDEAFQHGISFQAKYIGTMEVPRPSSRMEIVAAMRRIRYDYKAKNIKKKKVKLEISVDGVRVTLRRKSKTKQGWVEERGPELMQHPIYRIFYVSHDSSDLKIFSYIARDLATDSFRCSVFKSNKKSQAMRVVRTVGQAFEVCHKLGNAELVTPEPELSEPDPSCSEERIQHEDTPDPRESDKEREEKLTNPDESLKLKSVQSRDSRPKRLELPVLHTSLRRSPSKCDQSNIPSCEKSSAMATQHEIQLLREKLEQQSQQTQHAMSQLLLLREQLATETAARMEAQNRTQQLLVHNRELLDHIAALVTHLQDVERNERNDQHVPCTSTPPRSPALIMPQSALITPASPLPSFSSLGENNTPNSGMILDQLRNTSTPAQATTNHNANVFTFPLANNLNALLHQEQQNNESSPFIRPLSQGAALTAVDSDGHVRVIVPVSGANDNQLNPTMVTLRITDEGGLETNVSANNNAGLDRRAWSRHSTK